MLTVGLLAYGDFVTDVISVFNTRLVLTLIVLNDAFLLTLFDEVPVGLERDVEKLVSPEHQLG